MLEEEQQFNQDEDTTRLKEVDTDFNRFYKISLWWINNRNNLKKLGYGLIIFLEIILVFYILWVMIDSFLINYKKEQLAVVKMVALGQKDLHDYTINHSADELKIGGVSVFSNGHDHYDFYTSITNPNQEWWADFTYQFVASNFETKIEKGFILPNENKPIIVFSELNDNRPHATKFKILKINWHRVNRHLVGNYDNWYRERMSFEIKKLTIEKGTKIDTKIINQVRFTVDNQGAYSFYDPEFLILLKQGSRVVGVNSVTLSSLTAGESQDVIADWFGDMPNSSKVEIIPNINCFDQSIYKQIK